MLLAGLVASLAACAGALPAPQAPPALFHDRLFAPPAEPVTTADVFTPSEAMKRYLSVDIAHELHAKGAQTGLIEALYKQAQLKIEYDASRTKNAAEAFATRSGNCLSLVIMTAALARHLQLPVTYQSAVIDETWSRNGDLLFANGHVNISVGRRFVDARGPRDLSPLTIDFLPPGDISRLQTRPIREATVLAMYANNRAAEALAENRLDAAYAWAAEALRHDPGFASAYNTLGVVYLRHGDFAEAAAVFTQVLADAPRHTQALANLADTYSRQGRTAEAEATRRRLLAIEPYAPFHFFNLGLAAARRHDWPAARDLFAREVARTDYNPEFHFWLGIAASQLGDLPLAREEIALALKNSATPDQHALYAAKLAWLQSRRNE